MKVSVLTVCRIQELHTTNEHKTHVQGRTAMQNEHSLHVSDHCIGEGGGKERLCKVIN